MPTTTPPADPVSAKAVPILARSLFRQMLEQGYTQEQIIGFSAELISLVNEDLAQRQQQDLVAQ